MQGLHDEMELYHGSYTVVEHPDLAHCSRFKDFGRGFYLTSSREQARSFARLATRKAVENGVVGEKQTYGCVSSFFYAAPLRGELLVKSYDGATPAWLHCVIAHRKAGSFPSLVDDLKPYDVICGKVANDQTNATITIYMSGALGALGSEVADSACIALLLPERLDDQFCFRTARALSCLSFAGSERVSL